MRGSRTPKTRLPDAIAMRFEQACAASPLAGTKLQRLTAAYHWFMDCRLGDRNFETELSSADNCVYMEKLSEMLVAYLLMRAGFTVVQGVTQSVQNGCLARLGAPDFWVTKGDVRAWVEVVTPRPAFVGSFYLEQIQHDDSGMLPVPWNRILLRWTSAIKEKREKLDRYHLKGVVRPGDIYIVAVNGRNLRGASPIGFTGESGKPFVVEATIGAGPPFIGFVPLDNGRLWPELKWSVRREARSVSGSSVPLVPFLDPAHADLSAVWGMDVDEDELLLNPPVGSAERGYFASAVVLNHLANAPMPAGLLPAFEDWMYSVGEEAPALIGSSRIPFRPTTPGRKRTDGKHSS